MAEAKLSSKNQIVIPREARDELKLKPGDKLEIVVQGNMAILFKRPKSFAKAIRGIARGVYPEGYLEKERQSWDKPVCAHFCATIPESASTQTSSFMRSKLTPLM